MKNKIWVLSVGFVLLFPNLVHADETKEVEFFPADPETGLQIEVPDTNLQSKQQITERQALPEKFDFMDGGFETPIRDQGNTELCWAYSGTDVLRISMKKSLELIMLFLQIILIIFMQRMLLQIKSIHLHKTDH